MNCVKCGKMLLELKDGVYQMCTRCYEKYILHIKKTYRINHLIELKLENDKTEIYINGNKFIQCKYLLLNIPKERVKETNDYVDIDELAKKYSKENETNKQIIEPETEFFGHCSNLEAFVQNDYNPNVLHSSMSIPLLTELCKYDLGVFHRLLFHLEQYWLDYELEYDSKFTQNRRSALYERYETILKRAITTLDLDYNDINSSNLLRTCMTIDFLEKLIDSFKRLGKKVHCEYCNEKINIRRTEMTEVEIYSDMYDYYTVEMCLVCYDNIRDYDIEYCYDCGRYFDNGWSRNCVYIREYEQVLCQDCLKTTILSEGLPRLDLIHILNEISDNELLENNFKYVMSYDCKHPSQRKQLEADFDMLKNELGLEVIIRKTRDYWCNEGFEAELFIKAKREFWRFHN